ncbi:MAG: DUF1569 domain-containing protein [Planctomycetes bacterium]|nr:DUF1569 domain-containing protein [Planctomycetota bacterium]
MTVNTARMAGRRTLKFSGLDDVLHDAEQVALQPGKTVGNWSVAQILEHLSKSIQAGFEGPEVRAPWFVRWIIAPMIRERMLSRGMPAGFALPKKMNHFMPGTDADVQHSLQNLRTWINRLKSDSPTVGHLAFGKLSHADWIRLHTRHGELHLSFIVPNPVP